MTITLAPQTFASVFLVLPSVLSFSSLRHTLRFRLFHFTLIRRLLFESLQEPFVRVHNGYTRSLRRHFFELLCLVVQMSDSNDRPLNNCSSDTLVMNMFLFSSLVLRIWMLTNIMHAFKRRPTARRIQ